VTHGLSQSSPVAARETLLISMTSELPLNGAETPSNLEMIRHMILSKSLTTSQMAEAAECSKRSIFNISN
jgi:hypothetical protein